MIGGPIIRKEVLATLRTRKAVAMQAAMLLLSAGLIWLLWPADGLQDIGGQQARRILAVLGIGELAMVVLFAPVFTASSLTGEKERNSWESLYATALSPCEIALGKMIGSLAFLVLLVLTASVAMASVVLLGGVEGATVLAAMGILLLTAIELGAIGMLVSSLARRSYRAIIATYAVLLVLCVVVALPTWPLPADAMIERVSPPGSAALRWVASLSPLKAMLSLLLNGGGSRPHDLPQWQQFLLLSPLVTLAAAAATVYRLRRPSAGPRAREKLDVVERGKVTARSFLFILDPRKRRKSIAWWMNPVLVKEFRTRPMLQPHTLLRVIGVCAILSVVLMFFVSAGVAGLVQESPTAVDSMIMVVSGLLVLLLIVLGPAITSNAICSDRETGVWDLLRSTPLSGWRIVSGKFQAAVIPLLLLAMATGPALAILLQFRPALWPSVLGVGVVAGVSILFIATLGVFFSSVFRRTPTATAWTYGVVAGMAVAGLLMMLGGDVFSQRLVRTVFAVNPLAAALDAAGHPGMSDLGVAAVHVPLVLGATAVLFVVTVARVLQLRRPEK